MILILMGDDWTNIVIQFMGDFRLLEHFVSWTFAVVSAYCKIV